MRLFAFHYYFFLLGLGLSAQSTTVPYKIKPLPLDTPWTEDVGIDPWPEYPRPQLQRHRWRNLNGLWQYRRAENLNAVSNPPFGQALSNEVLIPSCLESGLSGRSSPFLCHLQPEADLCTGIQGKNTFYSWFTRKFTVPKSWSDEHVLLHFGAVDYEATVFVNGKQAGFHRGGFFHFSVDITAHVDFDSENELCVESTELTISENDEHLLTITASSSYMTPQTKQDMLSRWASRP